MARLHRILEAALGESAEPTLALLVPETAPDFASLPDWLKQRWPGLRLCLLHGPADVQRLHPELAAAGPLDVIVDLWGGPAVRRLRQLVFHVRRGGSWIAPVAPAGAAALLAEVDELRRDGLRPPGLGRDPRPLAVSDAHAFADAVALSQQGGFLVAVNHADALAKLREAGVDEYLRRRPEAGSVLETLPGGRVATAQVRVSDPAADQRLPGAYTSPALSLRRYRDVVCLPRQIAVQDHVLLPDTFRNHMTRRLRHPRLVDVAPLFVLEPDLTAEALPGAYYYLDNINRGHFGHVLTEQVSHLWGWRLAKERDPSLRALVLERPGFPIARWEVELLEAGGIKRSDLHVATGPVRVETLLAGSPMYIMNHVLHPKLRETYGHIGHRLAASASDRAWPRRVFLTRRARRRACHNAAEVESWFQSAGFDVVLPEELTLSDQARLVREAQVVGGFAGSGLFTTALAGAPKHLIVVGSESYTATNEHMFSALLGHRLDLVLCRPDVPRGDRFSEESYHSDFTFDPDREGVFLRRVLAEL